MRWYHTLGIKFIDLIIITIALVWIMLSIAPSQEWQLITADSFRIMLSVFLTYIIIVIVVEILLFALRGAPDSFFVNFAKAVLTTGFILWIYPKALWLILFLMGLEVAADVEFALLVTSLLRAFIRVMLGHRWKEQP